MNYHYLDANNQPAGPASLDEIRTFAQQGTIASDPMICAVGASEWKLMSATVGAPALPAAAKGLPFSGTILSDFVGRLVKLVGGILSPAFVERSLSLARHFGQYAVLLGGALGLIAAVVAAIQAEYRNGFGLFLIGVAYVIALIVAQFTASRFLGASDALIATTPSRLSSLAFLECLGVLAVLGAIGALLGGAYVAIEARSVATFIVAVLVSVLLAFYGAIALHPRLASVEAGAGSAGEEAIGILAFGLKATLKLVPLGFALLAIAGSLALIVDMLPNSRFSAELAGYLPSISFPGLPISGLGGLGTVLAATLLPMFGYFAFLIASLPLEIWRAILCIPNKLDVLRTTDRTA